MTRFTHHPADISAIDLREEHDSSSDPRKSTGRIEMYDDSGHLGHADYLYIPRDMRLGIAWGGDATWADTRSIEEGIDMWLNQPTEWERAN